MSAPNKKREMLPKIVQMNNSGMTVKEAAEELGVHPVTAQKWFRDEGITPIRHKVGRPATGHTTKTYTCTYCNKSFEGRPDSPRKFCSRNCTNTWQKENKGTDKICPCGKKIELTAGTRSMYHNRKYCGEVCRKKYGTYKQSDPNNYVTFNCQNCNKEVTRYKSYGKGYRKYCSNSCANRHTKTKKHVIVEDSTVLDSGFEVLFWGYCSLKRIPIERYDRENGVAWEKNKWYAPDFTIVFKGETLHVEIKGVEDEHDHIRWNTFQEKKGRLIVLFREDLENLLSSDGLERFLDQ